MTTSAPSDAGVPFRRYRSLRRAVVLTTAAVSMTPLVIMTLITFIQYQRTFRSDSMQPVSRLTSTNKRSLEFFLNERRSALAFIMFDRTFEQLADPGELVRIRKNMNRALGYGSFVDLGLIDAEGRQICYAGPFGLTGRTYGDQEWFRQVQRRGVFTSDVFLGYRQSPHIVIAMRHEGESDREYTLRATLDAGTLTDQIITAGLMPANDAFLVNREGVLQTPSRRYGDVLERIPLPVPPYSPGIEVEEHRDENGQPIILGYTYIENSPYILMMIKDRQALMGTWFTVRNELLGFLVVSAALILAATLWTSQQFVRRMRESDQRRAALLHSVEYTNKLASIGRLAAGVAHEINNPLAIINEKAGLLKDLVGLTEDFPRKEKVLGLVDSVIKSVARCRTVTHRLLGFAKHMDIQNDAIDLESLLREVFGFLDKEATYRNVALTFNVDENLPTIESDRGQLQQVFLNLFNNALAAVEDGGAIEVGIEEAVPGRVAVTIADNGVGIPAENMKRIFEPFFTTKEGSGTGLGLSITYGIVQKLGGEIQVASEVGEGTRFTVTLPVKRAGS